MMIKLTFETAGGVAAGAVTAPVPGLRVPGAALRFAPAAGNTPAPRDDEADALPEIAGRGERPQDWRYAKRAARRVEDALVVATLALLLALGGATVSEALAPAPVAPPPRAA